MSQKAAVAKDLIANAEGLTLGTLQEELPEYLESQQVPTSWLPQAFAARISSASGAVGNATRLAKSHAILLQNHHRLTHAIAKDVAAPQLLDPTQVDATQYTNPNGF